MRAGQLKDQAVLKQSEGAQIGGAFFIGIIDKDESIPYDDGLRSNASINIHCRWHPHVLPGNYWIQQGGSERIFLINGSSDAKGNKRDLVCSVTELVGAPVLVSTGDKEIKTKCALTQYRSKPQGEHDYLSSAEDTQRRQAEFANVQYLPEVGHEFVLAGAQYRIIELDDESSDHIVSRVWVQFLNYV